MPDRKISLCITTWERFELTLNSFADIVYDDRVQEIVVVDDLSSMEIYNKLKMACGFCKKIKLYRNDKNLGCYLNKRQAVKMATNDYVVLFDSDNIFSKSYLDKIYEYQWEENTIFAPDFASPNFSYQEFGGVIVDKSNVAEYMPKPMFSTALNTCNLFVNRMEYLEVFDDSIDPIVCDSIYFAYCWLSSGNKIHILKNLSYQHLVHSESHYKKFVHTTPTDLLPTIENNLRLLK